LGDSYRLAGDFKQAESILLKSLKMDSNGMLTHFNLGVLYKTISEIPKAIQSFQSSLEVNPHYVEAYYQLATIYLKSKNKQSAKLSLEKALQADPANEKFKTLYDQVIAS
jgi:Tfp pilus assembly protein PilF